MSAEPTPPPAELVSVPVPRAVAWIVGKIGWPGLLVLLVLAQASGWADVAFLALGLPPLMGAREPAAIEAIEDAPTERVEMLRADLVYQRAMNAETLSLLSQIASGCRRDRGDP